jgi:hypothetical protein
MTSPQLTLLPAGSDDRLPVLAAWQLVACRCGDWSLQGLWDAWKEGLRSESELVGMKLKRMLRRLE